MHLSFTGAGHGIKASCCRPKKDSLPVTDEEIDIDIDNRIRNYITQLGSKDELEQFGW